MVANFTYYIYKASFTKRQKKHCLLFLIVIFQVFLLFFLRQEPGGKGIVLYLLLKCFQPYF